MNIYDRFILCDPSFGMDSIILRQFIILTKHDISKQKVDRKCQASAVVNMFYEAKEGKLRSFGVSENGTHNSNGRQEHVYRGSDIPGVQI